MFRHNKIVIASGVCVARYGFASSGFLLDESLDSAVSELREER
jgi:hypothetical protein